MEVSSRWLALLVLEWVKSDPGAVQRMALLFEHDLFGKPVPTPHQVRGRLFPDHALANLAANHGGNKIGRSLSRVLGNGITILRSIVPDHPKSQATPKTKTPLSRGKAAFCLIVTRKEELLCPWQVWQRPTLPGLKP
jgi:hypothetical protein